jgi:hypothetical protein
VYERAVANLPPANEKRFWQRYVGGVPVRAPLRVLSFCTGSGICVFTIQVVKDQHLFSYCGLELCCRYIYLWIKYALFEEIDAGDMDRAREVYRAALKLVPHHQFTFSKVGVGTCEG